MYKNHVAKYPFMDHNAPAFELLLPCCAHIHSYLQEDQDNIVAVHCKAGKGRTGLIIVCYLLYGGLHSKAVTARRFYDVQRCYDLKGLTIISQIRYAHYFECYLRRLKLGDACEVRETQSPAISVLSVALHHITREMSASDLIAQVAVRAEQDHNEHAIYCSSAFEASAKMAHLETEWGISLDKHVPGGVRAAGDIKVQIFRVIKGLTGTKLDPLLHSWMHSQFMEDPPDMMAGAAPLCDL